MGMSQTNRINESHLERQRLLTDIRSELEHELMVALTATEILAHDVVRSQGKIQNFESIAQGILEQTGGITNLQLAPDGKVSKIHPLKGHLEALGHDILGDKRRNTDAFAAVDSGKLTLAGPLTLVQGGVAVIARKPVYLWEEGARKVKSVQANSERAPFWGFVSALIMLEDLIDTPTLMALSGNGYSYQFSRFDSGRNINVSFAESGKLTESRSDKMDIRVPNGTWTLAIGTNSAIGLLPSAFELAITILFSIALAVASPWLLRK